MKYKILFLFLLIYTSTIAQYTSIPDPLFEHFLIYNGYDTGVPDGKVLTSSINTITKLDISFKYINDLTGIEDFTALNILICNDNRFTALDLSKNTKLTILQCFNNQLTNLDVSKNIALKELSCSMNQLTSLNLSNNTALEILNCNSNKITNINLLGCASLKTIVCYYNNLTSIDFSECVALSELGCSNNTLIDLDVSKNINLIELSCNNNQLTNLDISKNIKLTYLSTSINQLTNLDTFSNTKLVTLYCESNQLTSLDLSKNIYLTDLNCSNNLISNLDLSKNIKITNVYCNNNQLTNLDISKNFFLSHLFCDKNQLTNLNTSSNPNLEILYCNNNQITSLDVTKNINLSIFLCENNQLTYLDLRSPNSWNWWGYNFSWYNNPNLKCIYVFDAEFSNFYWPGRKDATATYFDGKPPKFDSTTQTICSKQKPTLNDVVVSGYNIKWFDLPIGGNELSLTTPLTEGQTYYAINTAGNCESSRSSVTISLQPISAPTGVSPQNLCNIKNPTLSDLNVSGTLIQWHDAASGGNLLTNSTPLVNGSTYYASQTQNGCESERLPILVNLINVLKPTTTSQQTFCIQQNATINSIAITGQNIKWYDASTNGNLLVNTTSLQNGTTYYASQTINGCEGERTPVLINIQKTDAPKSIPHQIFCASKNPTLDDIIIAGTNIKWYDSLILGNILPGTTPLQNKHTYFATQTINGCENPTRLDVTTHLIFSLPSKNYEELFCDDLNDGTETVDLSSYNSDIIPNNPNYNFSYYSSLLGAENETAAHKIGNFNNYKLVLGDNKIYVRINSNTPCYAIAELKLTLVSKPVITIEDILPICENKTITIDAGAGFTNYLWSNGATTQKITISNSGNFSVTVTNDYDIFSCSSTKNFVVINSNKATINSIETKDWTDRDNEIKVFVTGNGDYEYSIDGINYQTDNQFTGLISDEYTIRVRDKNGCGTVTDEVYLLMYPKFFTPNGDGYNDTWKIKFSETETGLTVKIFDRYGTIIKLLNNSLESWDGTYNGALLPADDYWFEVTRANGKKYKGHFTLRR